MPKTKRSTTGVILAGLDVAETRSPRAILSRPAPDRGRFPARAGRRWQAGPAHRQHTAPPDRGPSGPPSSASTGSCRTSRDRPAMSLARDVGQVRGDQIVGAIDRRGIAKQVALDELDPAGIIQAQARSVFLCQARASGSNPRPPRALRAFPPRASTQSRRDPVPTSRQRASRGQVQLEQQFDEILGLGPRDQRAAVHGEIPARETPPCRADVARGRPGRAGGSNRASGPVPCRSAAGRTPCRARCACSCRARARAGARC